VAGNLSTTSAGAVSQTGTLTVTGTTGISAAGQSVLLDNAVNDFTGTATVTAGTTSLKDTNALTAVLATTGDTTLAAGGDLAVSGTVSGASSDLMASAAKISFGATTIDGNLTSTTHGIGDQGGVGQTGALMVKGTTQFLADSGTLQNAKLDQANDFQGAVSFNSANDGSWQNITLKDVNALTLGDITATGKLDATAATDIALDGALNVASLDLEATGGDITQGTNGTLTVSAGPSNLKAGDDITLDKANDFNGTVNVLGGNDVTLNDKNNLTLGDVTATGKLDATAGTDLALDGTISAATADLEATSGDIKQNSGHADSQHGSEQPEGR